MMAKVADFGLARTTGVYSASGPEMLPVRWSAPEAIEGSHSTCSGATIFFGYGAYISLADVWSFGILLWEIFSSGQTPFAEMDTNVQVLQFVASGKQMPSPPSAPLWVASAVFFTFVASS